MTRTHSLRLLVVFAAILVGTSRTARAQAYDLSWNTVDGGGVMFSAGGAYSLGATIAQPDAGSFSTPLTGGEFELVGGFWPVADVSQPFCRGDLNGDGYVSLSDLSALLSHFGTSNGASLTDGDLDGDHDVDLSDLADLLSQFGTTCP